MIGWKALRDSIERYGESHEFTKLVMNLQCKDPDDAFSTVPYEKGATLLLYLENLLGQHTWDPFIPHYFTRFRNLSLDTNDFKAALLDYFAEDTEAGDKLRRVDWNTWFHAPGYPPKPDFDSSLAEVCYALARKWKMFAGQNKFAPESADNTSSSTFQPQQSDIASWTANQRVVFLEAVQDFKHPLTATAAQKMGVTYDFLTCKNVEVVSRYYAVALRAEDKTVFGPVAKLLGSVGRMKFVRPLYRALAKADWSFAMSTYETNRAFYHPICRTMVEKDFSMCKDET